MTVFVTVDRWASYDHATALAESAERTPSLRHRVVVGEARTGAVDFAEHFEHTPWEDSHPVAFADARVDPDQVGLAVFTSGTSGEPKGVLHTPNTVYAALGADTATPLFEGEDRFTPADRFYTPHPLTHIVGA